MCIRDRLGALGAESGAAVACASALSIACERVDCHLHNQYHPFTYKWLNHMPRWRQQELKFRARGGRRRGAGRNPLDFERACPIAPDRSTRKRIRFMSPCAPPAGFRACEGRSSSTKCGARFDTRCELGFESSTIRSKRTTCTCSSRRTTKILCRVASQGRRSASPVPSTAC